MKTDCIQKGYNYPLLVPEFDDVGLTDGWQLAVYVFAKGIYELEGHQCVVDVGCGSAFKLLKLFHDSVIGIEANHSTLEWLVQNHSRKGVWFSPEQYDEFLIDPYAIDATKNEGVLMICSDVIEHVDDPVSFFDKLVSMPWKDMVISTPARELGGELDGPPGNVHHWREWSMAEFRKFLDQWEDEIIVRNHCIINPDQRTQMAWLQRKEKGSEPVPETGLPSEDGSSSSSLWDLESPALA